MDNMKIKYTFLARNVMKTKPKPQTILKIQSFPVKREGVSAIFVLIFTAEKLGSHVTYDMSIEKTGQKKRVQFTNLEPFL